jgi:hypothetical protein
MADRLDRDQQLTANQVLVSGNGVVNLVMQADGNLVEYATANSQPLWASNTNGSGATRAIMQGDGNFVLYDDAGHAKWASGTDRNPGAFIVLQGDGNLVIYNQGGAAVWANNVQYHPNHKKIPAQHVKWQQDYYQITSVDYDPSSRLAVVEQSQTNTFKLSGFTSGARVLFYSGDQNLIGSADNVMDCPQAPLIGAAHNARQWTATAPDGAQAVALLQYWRPSALDELGNIAENFFKSIGDALTAGPKAIDGWCTANPEACDAIAMTLFVIAGTTLCLAFPESCEVVVVIGKAFV